MAKATSPLRYPGGKSCLYDLTSTILHQNKINLSEYAEPFAGGCGLGLQLLYSGAVSDIHINDVDPSVWSFWHSVLERNEELIGKIESTPVDMPQWYAQKEVHREQALEDPLSLGFSTFFLNRTNRSGIIKGAGVIGGKNQNGNYKIDCRFNKEELIRRIKRIHKYRSRIHLTNLDALDFLENKERNLSEDTFFCIDPPYFVKGASLYTSFYKPEDHLRLAEAVLCLQNPWIVTYDDTAEIRSFYKSRRQYQFSINYSVQEKRQGTELLIASKGLRLPAALKDRQTNRPQYRSAAPV